METRMFVREPDPDILRAEPLTSPDGCASGIPAHLHGFCAQKRRSTVLLRGPLCLLLLCVCFAQTLGPCRAQTRSAGPTPAVTDKGGHPTLASSDLEPLAMPLPTVMSGGSDHCVKHWDATGRLSATVGTHDTSITAIAMTFVLDKKGRTKPLLISGGAGGQLKIWSVGDDVAANAMPLSSVKAHEGSITALAVTKNGLMIATGGADAYIRLWDGKTGRMLAEVKAHDAAVRSLKFAQDGSTLVSGGEDRLIRVWKVGNQGQTLDYQSTILAHDAPVTAIALSPDASTVASVSTDGYLKTWQIAGGSLLKHIRVNGRGVLTVAFSPDGKTIATGDEDGKIHLWNVQTGMPTPFVGSHERGVYALAWTADGAMLISGGGDKTLRYWNVATGHQIACIAAHDGTVQTIAIVP